MIKAFFTMLFNPEFRTYQIMKFAPANEHNDNLYSFIAREI